MDHVLGRTTRSLRRIDDAGVVHDIISSHLHEDDSLDLHGILWLEHINMLTGRREIADKFYQTFLGLVAQPGSSWHVNIGTQQFHLGTAPESGQEHVITGDVGLTVPSLEALRARVQQAETDLDGTKFRVNDNYGYITVMCPWGNTFCIHEARAEGHQSTFGSFSSASQWDPPRMARFHEGLDGGHAIRALGQPGIRYVRLLARRGTVDRIAAFYREVFGASVRVERHVDGTTFMESTAVVMVGPSVFLLFYEHRQEELSDAKEAQQAGRAGGEGLHIAIYIAAFKASYERLHGLGLTWTNPRARAVCL